MSASKHQEPALHEFMGAQREELLARAVGKLKPKAPHLSEEQIADGLPELYDEIVRALRRDAGLPEHPPKIAEVATTVGRARQRNHDDIGLVAFGIGAISDAMGEVGAEAGLRFAAREYQVFNQCIDSSTASAIEEYAARERAETRSEQTKRVGFLAHEIRNALASGTMAYASLKKGVVGINSSTGDILGRSLTAMRNLVGHTLAAVQLEGGAPVQRHRFRLGELRRQVEAAIVVERGVTLTWEANDDLAVEADPRLLTSAATNLVQNAIKFTRDGGLVVVRAQREAGKVVLEVEDECGGLPPGYEEALAAPFVQLADDGRGVGLGLAIAREAMVAQGGRLRTRNLPGKGCIFSIDIPAPWS